MRVNSGLHHVPESQAPGACTHHPGETAWECTAPEHTPVPHRLRYTLLYPGGIDTHCKLDHTATQLSTRCYLQYALTLLQALPDVASVLGSMPKASKTQQQPPHSHSAAASAEAATPVTPAASVSAAKPSTCRAAATAAASARMSL